MSDIEIVYMWGYADGFDLVFARQANGMWTTSVPPDLSDGQYAVEIHALAENGYICLWTGILYMNQGRHCLVINKKKYDFRLKPQVYLQAIRWTEISSDGTEREILRLLPPKYSIRLRRCCSA